MPLLFSYGDLQNERVQLSALGRRLNGERDEIPGYEQAMVKIDDESLVATSGKTHHANAMFNGNEQIRIAGMVFEIDENELASIDEFEAAFFYRRIAVRLASGREAWVYVHAPVVKP